RTHPNPPLPALRGQQLLGGQLQPFPIACAALLTLGLAGIACCPGHDGSFREGPPAAGRFPTLTHAQRANIREGTARAAATGRATSAVATWMLAAELNSGESAYLERDLADGVDPPAVRVARSEHFNPR